MSRLVYMHWHEAEAKERAERLRAAGHEVAVHWTTGGPALRGFRASPPEAFVIDLSRLPSYGREAGAALRGSKATRRVPLVFVGGDPDKVAGVRAMLPDATYTAWRSVRGAIRRALAHPVSDPVAPSYMQRFAGRPLVEKLGIKSGLAVALAGAPEGFEAELGPLPGGVTLRRRAAGRAELVVLFARSQAELARRFPAASRTVSEAGALWLAWPKQASGAATDLVQSAVRAYGLERGWVDFKICSVNATWSALCFARRGSGRTKRGS